MRVVTDKNGMLEMSRINVIFLTNVEKWPISPNTLLLAVIRSRVEYFIPARPTSHNDVK